MRDFPRRLTPPAPIGSLLDRKASAAPSNGKAEPRQDKDYLALVRQLPCLSCGHQPCGEAAHVNYNSFEFGRARSFGRRPHDKFAVPLCRDDHLNHRDAQHKGREETFWLGLDIKPYEVARLLHARRDDFVAMENVVRIAIAERKMKR